MRILLLLDSFEETLAGTMLYHLCQRWAPVRELRLMVLSFGPDGPLRERLKSLGVRTTSLAGASPAAIRAEGRRELFSKLRPDILHSHCAWPAMAARIYHGGNRWVPFLQSIHDDSEAPTAMRDRLMALALEKFTRGRFSLIATSTRYERDRLARRDIAREAVRLLPMGVDGVQCYPVSPPSRKRYRLLLGVEEDTPLAVTIGKPGRGHMQLLDAWRKVVDSRPEARLFLIGDGAVGEEIEARISALSLESSARRIGSLSEIGPRLCSSADVVIHPGGPEIYCYQLAQAGAAGAAALAWDHGANGEIIRHGETGLLVPPGDTGAMAAEILALLDDPDRREELGTAAREHILDHLELGNTARDYIELWRELAPDALWDQTNNLTAGEVDPFPLEVTPLEEDTERNG